MILPCCPVIYTSIHVLAVRFPHRSDFRLLLEFAMPQRPLFVLFHLSRFGLSVESRLMRLVGCKCGLELGHGGWAEYDITHRRNEAFQLDRARRKWRSRLLRFPSGIALESCSSASSIQHVHASPDPTRWSYAHDPWTMAVDQSFVPCVMVICSGKAVHSSGATHPSLYRSQLSGGVQMSRPCLRRES